jgi:NADH-quinone oxidoreductase subunit N
MGVSFKPAVRRAAPILSIIALFIAAISQLSPIAGNAPRFDLHWYTVHVYEFARYVKILSSGMGILLVLLVWPSNRDATGGPAHNFASEASEFFALMLLSIAGIFIIASANDIMLLFLGFELASIPTYIMVSISRPLPVAQEAGLKYFFLGAMSAAVMLFGFSYLFGTTGSTSLDEITSIFHLARWTDWQILAVILLICGFAFKMAAVPLHVYAGDVYQGAATPVTAFLSFVPKTAGFVALIKVLYAVGGGNWLVPESVAKTLLVLAALTMTLGNILGLLQFNIKRTFAYSSVAHTGYMLVGVTALVYACQLPKTDPIGDIQSHALQGVLFYLAAYGITNIAAFGVLQLLPSRHNRPATSAETFEDIAGQGRKHVALGLAMTVACLSLTGIPLTVGFIGKIYLTLPAGHANLVWLSIILWVNAAISAAYYLRIVIAMFLRSEPTQMLPGPNVGPMRIPQPASVVFAVMVSVILTLLLGTFFPATNMLSRRVEAAARMEDSNQKSETRNQNEIPNSKSEVAYLHR